MGGSGFSSAGLTTGRTGAACSGLSTSPDTLSFSIAQSVGLQRWRDLSRKDQVQDAGSKSFQRRWARYRRKRMEMGNALGKFDGEDRTSFVVRLTAPTPLIDCMAARKLGSPPYETVDTRILALGYAQSHPLHHPWTTSLPMTI